MMIDAMKLSLTIALMTSLLLGAPRLLQAKPAKGGKAVIHSVAIKGMKYAPASLTIKAGDSVNWENAEQRDHTVVAADGSFNSGNIKPGASFAFTFSKPGKYEYACSLHPRMHGIIIVQP